MKIKQQTQEDKTRINRAIVGCNVVRVTMDGNPLGIMSVYDAQQKANEAGLDLVEIVPHAQPPVCQIMDYGRFKFEQNKKTKTQRKSNKQLLMKEVQVRPVTGDHDLQTKVSSIRKFIAEGRIVQVTCVFSRREVMFREQGIEILGKITELLKDVAVSDDMPKYNDKKLQIRYRPVK